MRALYTIILIIGALFTFGQQLKPAINNSATNNLHSKVEAVKCIVKKDYYKNVLRDSANGLGNYVDDYLVEGGFEIGDTVPDFILNDSSGTQQSLSKFLSKKKPVLLVSGSHSCFIFRDRLQDLNYLYKRYGDSIIIAVIYIAEAHPYQSKSFYTCDDMLALSNKRDSIYVYYPEKLQDRLAAAKKMQLELKVKARFLIDDAQNNWLKNFGLGPNMAYLLHPDGYVVRRMDWFNQPPFDISYDIDKMLGHPRTEVVSSGGHFEVAAVKALNKGAVNQQILGEMKLINNSKEGVWLSITKEERLPFRWRSYFCADACYKPEVNRIRLYLKAESMQNIYLSVENPSLAMGSVILHLQNDSLPSDSGRAELNFISVDKFPAAYIGKIKPLEIHSMPNSGSIYLDGIVPQQYSLSVYNDMGRKVLEIPKEKMNQMINLSTLKSGHYLIWLTDSAGNVQKGEYYKM